MSCQTTSNLHVHLHPVRSYVFYSSPVIAPTCISQNAGEGTPASTHHQKTWASKTVPQKGFRDHSPKIHRRVFVLGYVRVYLFSTFFVSPRSFPAKIKERCSCCWMVRDVLRLGCFCWARCANPSASSMLTPIGREENIKISHETYEILDTKQT